MLKIHKDTVVYIFCSAKSVTGGPEALHQLCDAINLQGGKAAMVYLDYGTEEIVRASKPIPYRVYCTRAVTEVEDREENILIVPEIWPQLLFNYNRIQKAIWWLSVNYGRIEIVKSDRKVTHFYQSTYARNFLQAAGMDQVLPLYDYLNIPLKKGDVQGRLNQVCYNPGKGFAVTTQIIDRLTGKGISFAALKGLTKKGLVKVLHDSKVYIDFGEHPGKDRIPREAAIAGNIIVTSRNGSAGCYEDVPIPNEYKFNEDQIGEAARFIETCISEFEERRSDFDLYCREIQHQKLEFFTQCHTTFIGPNFSRLSMLANQVMYKMLPVRYLVYNAEQFDKGIKNSLSAEAKKSIRKLPYFKR